MISKMKTGIYIWHIDYICVFIVTVCNIMWHLIVTLCYIFNISSDMSFVFCPCKNLSEITEKYKSFQGLWWGKKSPIILQVLYHNYRGLCLY